MPNKDEGYWFTTDTGVHIHVNPGETKEQAMKRRFGESKTSKQSWEKFSDNRFGRHNQKTTGGHAINIALTEQAVDEYSKARDAGDTNKADAIVKAHQQYMKDVKNTEPKIIRKTETVTRYDRVEDTRYFTEKQVKYTYKKEVNPAESIFRKTLKDINKKK